MNAVTLKEALERATKGSIGEQYQARVDLNDHCRNELPGLVEAVENILGGHEFALYLGQEDIAKLRAALLTAQTVKLP